MPEASSAQFHTVSELLAPARDLACGRTAIDCGADAVYIGAPRFGAREAAGNSLDDIAGLTRYAHTFWARVYVTLNTVLYNHELDDAVRLAWKLHEIGVDGLIIQDLGLFSSELPPIALIASTQTHNHTPGRVRFLQDIGFHRAILARELTLEEIRTIREAAPRIELECFVHGAICVCYSGQCYLSYALGGRSGNRGQCAQPCRKLYSLTDEAGEALGPRRHYLSLKDLSLADDLPQLLDAGVTSFKIEGRLKDATYVANVVSYFRSRLDAALAARGMTRSSSGTSTAGFVPDPAKTFNRGYTRYFLGGRLKGIGALDTPKMVGEPVGRVARVQGRRITLEHAADLHPGDGVSYFDKRGELCGVQVNTVEGAVFTAARDTALRPGMQLCRNHDHQFLKALAAGGATRTIAVRFVLRADTGGMVLYINDEDHVSAESRVSGTFEPAEKPEQATEVIQRQLAKTGDTPFGVAGVQLDVCPVPFVPASTLNALRREALAALTTAREVRRHERAARFLRNDESGDSPVAPIQEEGNASAALTFEANVLNRRAGAFYRMHGMEPVEPAAESGLDLRGRRVMTTRYCLRHELGFCPRQRPELSATPLRLTDEEGHRLRVVFNCGLCQMEIYLDP